MHLTDLIYLLVTFLWANHENILLIKVHALIPGNKALQCQTKLYQSKHTS